MSNAIVLLPSKIEDHLNVGVTAIELDGVEGCFRKFPNLTENFYLREGTLTIVETDNVDNPTTISLKVIEKNACEPSIIV